MNTYPSVIDVSHWQNPESVDYSALKAKGIAAVMVKITEGASYVDPRAKDHAAKASAAGLQVGAYHFVDPLAAGAAQADHFWAQLQELGTSLSTLCPLWLDLERGSGGWDEVSPSDRVKRLCHLIIELEAVSGCKAGIYTGTPFWNENFDKASVLGPQIGVDISKRALWIAAYHDINIPPTIPDLWDDWQMWQYTDKGSGGLDTSFAKWLAVAAN